MAWVTGASGGIGRAVGLSLAQDGLAVALGYHRNRAGALAALAEVRAAGAQGELFCVDVSDPDACSRTAAEIEAHFGRLDVLVNNAGTALAKLVLDTAIAEWDALMAVHLRGAFVASKAALPGMIRRGHGRIVNITSMWGQVGAANEVAYATAKAGLIGFTKALAKEVAGAGVTVNAVAPGVIDTPMLGDLDESERADLVGATPVGRLGLPVDVARVVAFLAAEPSDFITGQVVAPNGGFVV